MRSVHKPLALYFIALATMGLAFWQPCFSWLLPVALLILLCGVIWLWRAEGYSVRDLGLHRVASRRRNLGWGFLVGLILPTVLVTVQTLSGWITLTPAFEPRASVAMIVLLAVGRTASMVALEELVFRGYFLQRFSFEQGTRLAVLLSSLLWAIMHVPAMVDSGLPPMFVAMGMATFVVWGAALSIGFLHTNNTLWFPLGLHYGYNFGYSLIGGFTVITYHAPRWLLGHPAWTPESGLLGLLLWATVLVAIWWSIGRESANC